MWNARGHVCDFAAAADHHLSDWCSLHQGEIAPEVRDALNPAEERREVSHVDYQDVARPAVSRWQPQQGVKFLVSSGDERMWPLKIDGLAREHPDPWIVVTGQCVVRQMHVESERGNLVE